MRIPSLLYVKGALENPIIDRLCYLISTNILFFCAANRDDRYPVLNKLFNKKIHILEIGLNLNLIEKIQLLPKEHIRSELNINSNNLNCVVLGQLYEPKGQHIAISALAKLVESHPNIRLYIVGDHVISEYKEYRLKLNNLISQLGLESNVYFTGWRGDALEIVNTMDLVIHPSFAEGFGRAVLESMALGKPVIASAVGGLREAISSGKNGYLVPPGDIASLAQRWKELASDQELRLALGSKARETVYLKYSAQQKVQKLEKIFLSMTRSSRTKCVE
jgi:glycosyltransferase involved in cell wall biosynthesis